MDRWAQAVCSQILVLQCMAVRAADRCAVLSHVHQLVQQFGCGVVCHGASANSGLVYRDIPCRCR